MMWEKNRCDPPRPRSFVRTIPEDLDALCMRLLSREPGARPAGGEILHRLGAATVEAPTPAESRSVSFRPGPFVGRKTQLQALRDAFEATRSGRAVSVYVHGTSGIGKSALVRRYLEELRTADPVILAGRCYERESTPYKAMDSVIDSLSRYLKRLPTSEAEALLPADILALTRVFPVLRRVEVIASARRKVVEVADSLELRRRAFAALRELLVRLAARCDVILFIDDLQWGDADSSALLEELMRPPDAPALLLIAAYRSEEAATSPLLLKLLAKEQGTTTRRVAVEELTPEEARQLAAALLESYPSALSAQADAIARESAGNPFFIDELIRFGRVGAEATIDAMVRSRVLQLPEPARRLLEVVAVAGQPLDADIADAAAELGGEDGALAVLRAGRLVRIRAVGSRREIEPYHDRIRETVAAHIEESALRELHRRLALALELTGADPEQLVRHFHEAGDRERAARYAASAADRAAETLAFDRAARFYRMALETRPAAASAARRDLQVKLGDALANAGRGREAAKAYLDAATKAPRTDALELERRAAAQLLRAGHLGEAMPLLELITGRLGLTVAQPTWRTLLLFFWHRARIRMRGVRFRERDASKIPSEQLVRLDTYWTLASGVSMINSARAREFQNRHFLLALDAGEPYRVAIAIATESAYLAADGWSRRDRIAKLQGIAWSLAERVRSPQAMGITRMWGCCGALFLGRWKDSWELGEAAEQIFREQCTGVAWELDMSHILTLRATFYLGGLRELSRRLPLLVREAQERDDLVAVQTLSVRHMYPTHLAADRAEAASLNLNDLMASAPREGFRNLHFWALSAQTEIALYAGSAGPAWSVLAEKWKPLKRSGLHRLQLYRIESWHLRARLGLALAAEAPDRSRQRDFLASAASDVRRIEREGTPVARGFAKLLRAGIAQSQGPLDLAPSLLREAEESFAALDMALYAAAARRRRGELLGGDEGKALVADADAWMAGQDIKNPERMAGMLAPGRWS
jgi:hypothetical protein